MLEPSCGKGYTQEDVTKVAKVLTGWTIDRPYRGGGGFMFDQNRHERGRRRCWGRRFSENGEKEGLEVLHMLATSPATAQFISHKLAVRFVSDDPPKALVDRMAKTFLATRRRHQGGAADDVRCAGVLVAGGVSREGEDADRVCGVGAAGERCDGGECAAAGAGDGPAGDAAVRDADAERLFVGGGAVGEHDGAGVADEFCAGAERRIAAGDADGLAEAAGRSGSGERGDAFAEDGDSKLEMLLLGQPAADGRATAVLAAGCEAGTGAGGAEESCAWQRPRRR